MSALPAFSHFGPLDELNDVILECEKVRLEASLLDFFIEAWPVFDPGVLKVNWHHEAIAEHLMAVTSGEIRHILIMIPPRCSKSLLVNVAYPAWCWARRWRGPISGPQVKFMCLSYAHHLAHNIATTARRLILSPWYQQRWGDRVQIMEDQGSIDEFSNSAGGLRIAGFMGSALGRGADVRILDDPLSLENAESEIEREKVRRAYDEGLATRATDPATTAEIIIMQRLREDDLAGHVLDRYGDRFTTLCLPMRFDSRRAWVSQLADPVIEADPRTEDGELLWPEQFPERVVAEMEGRLGEFSAAGQLQQAPVPRGGGIIKREWWRLWPDDAPEAGEIEPVYRCPVCRWADYWPDAHRSPEWPCPQCHSTAQKVTPFPEMSFRLLSVDTAYADNETASFSALTAWGVWHGKDDSPRVILTDAWRGRPRLRGYPDAADPKERMGLVEVVYTVAVKRRCDLVLIERKTRGHDLYNELERLTKEWPFQVAFTDPTGHGTKAQRLEACGGLFTNDLVWAPDLAWAEMVIAEVCAAPFAKHNDWTDTCSAALRYLRDSGMLLAKREFEKERLAERAFRGRGFDASELYGA